MITPWKNSIIGLFNIILMPLKLIWLLLCKIFDIYEDLCPSINWQENG
jgi:hypothetical protein